MPPFTLYTIGHSTHPIESLIGYLQHHSINTLVDVRSQPASRYNPQYNKAALESSLTEAGIRYRFAGQYLGGRPQDPALYTDGEVDYLKMMQSDDFVKGMTRLLDLTIHEAPVAILCSEGDPLKCHRHHLIARSLIDPVYRIFDVQDGEFHIEVRHIDKNGALLPPVDADEF